jgi:hypothetical protein
MVWAGTRGYGFYCHAYSQTLENGWKKKEDEDVRERGEWEEIWCNDVNYGGIEQIFPWVQASIIYTFFAFLIRKRR